MPVVQVVEVDGIADFPFVRDVVCAEDARPDVVSVVVAGDRCVERRDCGGVQCAAGLGEYPCFALRVGGLAFGDECLEGDLVETEAGEDHGVVAISTRRVVWMEFPGGTERGLEPEPWKMEDAEWTGGARADHGDNGWHGFRSF